MTGSPTYERLPAGGAHSHPALTFTDKSQNSCSTLSSFGMELSIKQNWKKKEKSTWDLLHCRMILYQLSYQGSP